MPGTTIDPAVTTSLGNPPPDSGAPNVPVSPMDPDQAPAAPAAPNLGSGVTPAPASAQPAAPQPPPPPSPAQMKVSKLAQIGHVASSLLGQQFDYRIDPATGKTVQTPIQQKPGDLFRHIVAGAILGGAAGAGQHGGVGSGAAIGAGAVMQDGRNQDLLRRAQAQQQFGNEHKAAQEQREASAAKTEDQLKQSEIAFHNVQTIHENQLIQGEGFDLHEKMAASGKNQIQPYVDAGLPLRFKDTSESEMNDLQKNNPEAAKLLWEPTGTKLGIGKDGQPTFETTYSAVDPKGQVSVTKALLDQWKESGMDKYYPEAFDVLKPGSKIDARQMGTLNTLSQKLANEKFDREKNAATVGELQARTREYNSSTAKNYAERDNYLRDKKQSEVFSSALKKFSDVKGDWSKLAPSDQIVLGESAAKADKEAVDGYKAALTQGDQDAAKGFLKDHEFYSGLVKQGFGQKEATAPSTAPTAIADQRAGALFQKYPNSADAFNATEEQVNKGVITPEEGKAIMGAYTRRMNAAKTAPAKTKPSMIDQTPAAEAQTADVQPAL